MLLNAKSASTRVFFSTSTVLSLLLLGAPIGEAADPAPLSTGAKIGTAIKDAIDIALPSVGSLIELIFGKSPKKDATTTKTEAENALTKPTKDTVAQVKASLKPVQDEVDELTILNAFSVPTALAQVELATVRGNLEAASPDWTSAKLHWKGTASYLADISAIPQSDIDKKVHTDSTKLLLMNAKEAAKRANTYLDNAIQRGAAAGSKDSSKALAEVVELEKAFRDVVKLVAIVSVDMREALDVVAKYSKANAGAIELPARQLEIEQKLRKKVQDGPEAKAVMESKSQVVDKTVIGVTSAAHSITKS